jgi:hypothetical protein
MAMRTRGLFGRKLMDVEFGLDSAMRALAGIVDGTLPAVRAVIVP